MHEALPVALILLGSAVAVVVLFRRLSMPAILGYLIVGVAIGPGMLGLVSATEEKRYLAEFGVVFLMFSVGLEFSLPQLMAMRRTGKEAYLFNYNGEFHGLRRRQNQKDFAIRMQQFFDHFLKDAPKPEWMQKGIPYLEREEEKERFKKATTSGSPDGR